MIYRKLIEDKHVVKLRGTQMLIKKNNSSVVIAQLLKIVQSSLIRHRPRIKEPSGKIL